MNFIIDKYTRSLILLLGVLCMGFTSTSVAQNSSDAILKQQRVLFVYNVAQQVVWDGISSKEYFTIGVVGGDPALIDFKRMSKGERKILGKPVRVIPVEIRNINTVEVDILYANYNYFNKSTALLRNAILNNTLLITEYFRENNSMINMVRSQEAYAYQINESNIKQAGLTVSSNLNQGAVKNTDKWLRLYQKAEKELTIVEEQNENQKEIIEQQLEVIDSKEEVITKKEKSIKTLINRSNRINKKLDEQLEMEEQLEERISSQKAHLASQKASIDSIKQHIVEQQEILKIQTQEIEEKEVILGQKTKIISNQKMVNWLLLGLLILTVIFAGIISFGFSKYRNLNKLLKEQQLSIVQNSKLLEAKNRELEQFAYITSHDLQEPLNSISSFINMLEEDYEEKFDEDGKTILGFIRESSGRMSKLIEALLQYSRLGRNQDYTIVNSNELLDNVQLDISASIKENNAQIIVEDLPNAFGNKIELRLLFQNIINNAIKFKKKDEDPIIVIKGEEVVKDKIEYHQFSISDNGIGIKEEHINRIFGIFQRLNAREDYKGSGIGLAHCEKIIKSHNGNLWVDSQVGKGSTFYFTIPKEIPGSKQFAA